MARSDRLPGLGDDPGEVAEGDLTLQSDGPEETFALGRALGLLVAPGDVVGLLGDLGAGKTLFAQGVAQGLDVDPRYRVASPTFTLINEYPGRVPLNHIDLYRLSDIDEMVEIGLFELLGGRGVCLVEWFERLEEACPEDRLEIEIVATGDEHRKMSVHAVGVRHRALLAAWHDRLGQKL
ncbi:MAG: tRNA (adenosine(37)-N6)-threonylcarbamoyltransferase complex ATPase subunit type 1 TsaE [Deltaproteobacteria bacterium]|nr:tRNA (adenosine(37)-N6)-threonylcarbamoyltransferase complex ATPase subunit type 1 TsaE [Deltaproteobacteria bacterium]